MVVPFDFFFNFSPFPPDWGRWGGIILHRLFTCTMHTGLAELRSHGIHIVSSKGGTILFKKKLLYEKKTKTLYLYTKFYIFLTFRSNCTNLQTAGGGDVVLIFCFAVGFLCIFKTLHVNSNVQLTLFTSNCFIFCVSFFFAVLLKVAFLVCRPV